MGRHGKCFVRENRLPRWIERLNKIVVRQHEKYQNRIIPIQENIEFGRPFFID